MLKKIADTTKIIADYKLLEMFITGVISAMPMAFLNTTMVVWLKEAEVEIALITIFAFTKLPSSLRFLWSPFIDNYSIPLLPAKVGHRKKWFMLCALLMSILLFLISITAPENSLKLLFVLCFILAFISASYDINFDAYRVEIFEPEKHAIGAASAVLGYKFGWTMLQAGGLEIASHSDSWPFTIMVISIFFSLSVIVLYIVVRDGVIKHEHHKFGANSFKDTIFQPFSDLLTKKRITIILIGVVLFKAGEATVTAVILPYYLEIGFTKAQIAQAFKMFGLASSILGAYLGVVIIRILGAIRGLIISEMLQISIILLVVWLKSHAEPYALYLVIIGENICEGISAVILVSYLSTLCNKQYSASQYALLSSASGLFGNSVAAYSGKLVEILDWPNFFIVSAASCLPSLIIFLWLYLTSLRRP